MKTNLPLLASLLTLAAVPATAQDVVAANPKVAKVKLDNDRVRVIEITLAPGDTQPVHTHPANLAYVLSGGSLKVSYVGGASETMTAKKGDVLWSDPEGPHTSENVGKGTLRYILVEVKTMPFTGAK